MNARGPTVPPIPAGSGGDQLVATINDRLRRLQAATSAVTLPGRATSAAAPAELVLAVPGVLGVTSSAAPLVSLAAVAQPRKILALVKTAPAGAALTVQVLAGGSQVGLVTIAAGSTSASMTGGTVIPPDTVITLAITSVGTTFPGADLTVMLRF